ncbi:MAG: hypothetical protein ACFFB3_16525, partial [Candidatus Hodarchaeota archaeon]
PESESFSEIPLTRWKKGMETFVSELRKQFDKGLLRFSLTPFVPKPHTKFQNSLPNFNRMKKEQDSCIPIFRKARIRFSLGSLRWAPVQAFLSMADERAAQIIRKVSLKSGHLVAWKKTLGDFTHLLEREVEFWNDRFSSRYSTEWL